jgi:hypothetical protein
VNASRSPWAAPKWAALGNLAFSASSRCRIWGNGFGVGLFEVGPHQCCHRGLGGLGDLAERVAGVVGEAS